MRLVCRTVGLISKKHKKGSARWISVDKGAYHPDCWPEFIPTYMVERENCLPQVVLSVHVLRHSCLLPPIYTEYINKCEKHNFTNSGVE